MSKKTLPIINKDAGKALSVARESKNLTQGDVAEKLNLGRRQYQNIEAGKFPKFKKEQIKNLDAILGTKVFDMVYSNLFKVCADKHNEKDEEMQPKPNPESAATSGDMNALYGALMDKLDRIETSLKKSNEIGLANSSLGQTALIHLSNQEARHVEGSTGKKIFENALKTANLIYDSLHEDNVLNISTSLVKDVLK